MVVKWDMIFNFCYLLWIIRYLLAVLGIQRLDAERAARGKQAALSAVRWR